MTPPTPKPPPDFNTLGIVVLSLGRGFGCVGGLVGYHEGGLGRGAIGLLIGAAVGLLIGAAVVIGLGLIILIGAAVVWLWRKRIIGPPEFSHKDEDEKPKNKPLTEPPPHRPGFWRFVGLVGSPIFTLFLLWGAIEWVAGDRRWPSFAAAVTVGLLCGPVAAAVAYAAGRSGRIARICLGGLFSAACGALLGGGHPVTWLPGGQYSGSLVFALIGLAVGALIFALPTREKRGTRRRPGNGA